MSAAVKRKTEDACEENGVSPVPDSDLLDANGDEGGPPTKRPRQADHTESTADRSVLSQSLPKQKLSQEENNVQCSGDSAADVLPPGEDDNVSFEFVELSSDEEDGTNIANSRKNGTTNSNLKSSTSDTTSRHAPANDDDFECLILEDDEQQPASGLNPTLDPSFNYRRGSRTSSPLLDSCSSSSASIECIDLSDSDDDDDGDGNDGLAVPVEISSLMNFLVYKAVLLSDPKAFRKTPHQGRGESNSPQIETIND